MNKIKDFKPFNLLWRFEMNKKADVSITITWIVATLVTLVLMLLFMVASGVISFGGGPSVTEISPLKFPEQQQSLFAISKTPEVNSKMLEGDYSGAENSAKTIASKIKFKDVEFKEVYAGYTVSRNLYFAISKNPQEKVTGEIQQNFNTVIKVKPDMKLRIYINCSAPLPCLDLLE